MQHLIGRSLLLHVETAELQHLHWRQDARKWYTHAGFSEGQQRALQSTGKMRTDIFSHFVCLAQPPPAHVFPGLKGAHNSP